MNVNSAYQPPGASVLLPIYAASWSKAWWEGRTVKRRFEVEVGGTVTIEIDDEARSDWKPGQGILDTIRDPERFVPGSDMETLLLALAVTVAIDNRPIGGSDGWADFPRGAVVEWGRWPDWQCEGWREITDGPR